MFDYTTEKRKFTNKWSELRKKYEAAGMSKEAIQELYDYDWKWFKSRRVYQNHTQELPSKIIDDDNENNNSILFTKFETLSERFNEKDFTDRYDWIETIEDAELVKKLKMLSADDLELLTLITQKGYTQNEVSILLGIPYRTTKYKYAKIVKVLQK